MSDKPLSLSELLIDHDEVARLQRVRVALIEAGDALRAENERLRAEIDQYRGDFITSAAEIERLRTKLGLLAEMCRPGLEDAPDGPATFLRAARKILVRHMST
jgi:uncharacterized membrane protein affecting hemolysin expression